MDEEEFQRQVLARLDGLARRIDRIEASVGLSAKRVPGLIEPSPEARGLSTVKRLAAIRRAIAREAAPRRCSSRRPGSEPPEMV